MRLARKLQLAYLILLFIPVITVGSLILMTYYTQSNSVGFSDDLDAPGWIRGELAAIFEEDWERYAGLRERVVIFVLSSGGQLVFPGTSDRGVVPPAYPFPIIESDTGRPFVPDIAGAPEPPDLRGPMFFPELYLRSGADWTLDMSITPIRLNDEPFMVAWNVPNRGIPGFIANRGWLVPMFVLMGIMLIPAFIDARLRRSITRLQDAADRISGGILDIPIEVSPKDDLADLAESLESARIELKESRDRKARVLMAVSHDLRTPLTSIRGYIEALGDGLAETPEDFERYLGVLDEKAGLLEGRINELIDFARSDTEGWRGRRNAVPIEPLVRRLDAAFRKDSGFAGRPYSSEIPDLAGLAVAGDERALYRAWENLFSNALRHTGDAESIRFRVGRVSGHEPVFWGEIADEGRGVDADFVPLLFEPFARADRGRNTEGLGLGLASVKAVAEAHGGSIRYRPNHPRGSVFRIELPCMESPESV